ncbi:MAG: hypothetical protein LC793_16325 [Thermomicrobia bacterium]|nr:hypothetical protein [Thermomicrobia bacterium]
MTAPLSRAEQERFLYTLIAARLSIAPEAVNTLHLWEYELGHMDDGACSTLWLRDFRPATAKGDSDGSALGR